MPKQTLTNPLVVWAGDIHSNSTVAVAPPISVINDENTVNHSKAQAALWEAWLDAWKWVASKKRSIVLVLGGEVCDIDYKRRSDQIMTYNPEKAQENALTLLEPALDVSDRVIVLRGTEAHTGQSAWTDEGVAKAIHKDRKNVVKNGRQFSWWEGDFFIGGRKFNLAHHVNMGSTPRTERDAANHLSADLMMAYGRTKTPFPDFAMRGHVHRISESGANYPIKSVICPSWQLQTAFIHRLGGGSRMPEVGIVTVDPATREVEARLYETKREEPVHI